LGLFHNKEYDALAVHPLAEHTLSSITLSQGLDVEIWMDLSMPRALVAHHYRNPRHEH
jgi:hypothetical protein